MAGDPFRALGLPPSRELTDDDVRAAWRRVAAATHPDRADGGDPAAFAAAANAYSDLRTTFGRHEALTDFRGPPRRRAWPARPVRLLLRLAAAVAVSALVVVVAGWAPATPALMVGALTWLILGSRHDLAARPRRAGQPRR